MVRFLVTFCDFGEGFNAFTFIQDLHLLNLLNVDKLACVLGRCTEMHVLFFKYVVELVLFASVC